MEPKQLQLTVGTMSEPGRREQNQDRMSAFVSPFGAIYMVADGMGGHKGGAVAAQMVVDGFERHLTGLLPNSMSCEQALTLAARQTNAELFQRGTSGDPSLAGMGSTLAVASIRDLGGTLELITANVGDSRVYLQRNGALRQLTKDHTQVQALVDHRIIDEETARHHPDASILTRAMGQLMDLAVEISPPEHLLDGDGILICSDGLSGFVPSQAINRTIQANPEPAACASALFDLAMTGGSSDNVTVQFVRIGTSPPPVVQTPRKTLPDQQVLALPALSPEPPVPEPAPPMPAPASPRAAPASLRPAPRKPSLALLFTGLLIGLGLSSLGAYLFRNRLFPKPAAPVKRTPVEESLRTLNDGATALNQEAGSAAALSDRRAAECTALRFTAKEPQLGKRRDSLKTQFETLSRSYRDIEKQTSDLVTDVNNYQLQLASLVKADPAATLQKKIESSTGKLKRNQDQFAQLQRTRAGLEKELEQLRNRVAGK
jgi:protein phosphatase